MNDSNNLQDIKVIKGGLCVAQILPEKINNMLSPK